MFLQVASARPLFLRLWTTSELDRRIWTILASGNTSSQRGNVNVLRGSFQPQGTSNLRTSGWRTYFLQPRNEIAQETSAESDRCSLGFRPNLAVIEEVMDRLRIIPRAPSLI